MVGQPSNIAKKLAYLHIRPGYSLVPLRFHSRGNEPEKSV